MSISDFTKAARAEAMRRNPPIDRHPDDFTYPRSALREHKRGAFEAGAEWARDYLISLEEAMVRSLAVASTHTGQDLVEAARIMRAFAQEPTDAERCTACGEDPSGPLRPLTTDERSYRYAQDLGYELPEDPR